MTLPGCPALFFVEVLHNPREILRAVNRHDHRPAEASAPSYQLTWDVEAAFPWDPGYAY